MVVQLRIDEGHPTTKDTEKSFELAGTQVHRSKPLAGQIGSFQCRYHHEARNLQFGHWSTALGVRPARKPMIRKMRPTPNNQIVINPSAIKAHETPDLRVTVTNPAPHRGQVLAIRRFTFACMRAWDAKRDCAIGVQTCPPTGATESPIKMRRAVISELTSSSVYGPLGIPVVEETYQD